MKTNGLARLYDRLTPEERFKLHVEAFARNDLEEAARLRQACPLQTYRIGDPAFFYRLDACRLAVLATALDVTGILTRLAFNEGLRKLMPALIGRAEDAIQEGWFEGARWAWQAAGRKGDPPWPEEERSLEEADHKAEKATALLPRALDGARKALSDEAKTTWAAFGRFCQERFKMDPRTVMAAYFPPALADWDALADALEHGDADPAGMDRAALLLEQLWDREMEGVG